MLVTILFLILGLGLLYWGAEWLVKGSSLIARYIKISAIIIGLTVVSFATSAPELFVSVTAQLKGSADIAVGNVVGSNIANIGLILGLAALVSSLKIHGRTVKNELPMVIMVSALLFILCIDKQLSRLDGTILIILFGLFLYYNIYFARKDREEKKEIEKELETEKIDRKKRWLWNIFRVLIGLALLVIGSKFLVDSSVEIAKTIGISEMVIGLTLVAIGTSIPELATSLVATIKKEQDISVGNVVGSNIFNILLILGVASLISPIDVNFKMVRVDMAIMIFFAVLLLYLMRRNYQLSRWEGGILLVCYVSYIIYLFTGK